MLTGNGKGIGYSYMLKTSDWKMKISGDLFLFESCFLDDPRATGVSFLSKRKDYEVSQRRIYYWSYDPFYISHSR